MTLQPEIVSFPELKVEITDLGISHDLYSGDYVDSGFTAAGHSLDATRTACGLRKPDLSLDTA